MWHGDSGASALLLPSLTPRSAAENAGSRFALQFGRRFGVCELLGLPRNATGWGGALLLPILQMKLLSLARASYVYLLVVPPIDGEDLAFACLSLLRLVGSITVLLTEGKLVVLFRKKMRCHRGVQAQGCPTGLSR